IRRTRRSSLRWVASRGRRTGSSQPGGRRFTHGMGKHSSPTSSTLTRSCPRRPREQSHWSERGSYQTPKTELPHVNTWEELAPPIRLKEKFPVEVGAGL